MASLSEGFILHESSNVIKMSGKHYHFYDTNSTWKPETYGVLLNTSKVFAYVATCGGFKENVI